MGYEPILKLHSFGGDTVVNDSLGIGGVFRPEEVSLADNDGFLITQDRKYFLKAAIYTARTGDCRIIESSRRKAISFKEYVKIGRPGKIRVRENGSCVPA